MDPEPFLRGRVFRPSGSVAYPRARPSDRRIPSDTWAMASVPVGVRLELAGDAEAVEVVYETRSDDAGWQGDAGRRFEAWRDEQVVGTADASLGEGKARIPIAGGDEPVVIYLPERMLPRIIDVEGTGGDIAPAPQRPGWYAYGDSITEGWCASAPALTWPCIVARARGLDVVNMGYAGAARGELPVAETLAELGADLITIAYGTNCWLGLPHTPTLLAAGMEAFLDIVRQGHPETPILVISPILRPQAEVEANRLGATLADLRAAMEETVRARADDRLHLLPGLPLVTEEMLVDGVHPDDAGHRAIAGGVLEALETVMR